ncbi:hypothetical protein RRF57_011400 [Xylaria bambusicola]|uniref:Uncharacterized protein n=1 Tax=Xylaria bambusicola TaxID=326684 RepID=A0AAN7UY10_9PEZI
MKGNVIGAHAHDSTAYGEVRDEVEGADTRVLVGISEAEDEVDMVWYGLNAGGSCSRACSAEKAF